MTKQDFDNPNNRKYKSNVKRDPPKGGSPNDT